MWKQEILRGTIGAAIKPKCVDVVYGLKTIAQCDLDGQMHRPRMMNKSYLEIMLI
jgi:hypothetical protein